MSFDQNLFTRAGEERAIKSAPLAQRIRPVNLEDFKGQDHLVGPGKILRQAIENDEIFSIILWGPPGCGKTTLAHIIANQTDREFISISAVLAGVKDLRQFVEEARERLGTSGKETILFIDEIHRFNKSQQDALLPHVEKGTVTLIGATTENPSFEVNSALLSRSKVLVLKPLTEDSIGEIVKRALDDKENGFGKQKIKLTEKAFDFLVRAANGDARSALNALEVAIKIAPEKDKLDIDVIESAYQRKHLYYDKKADAHYDTISAFIKSLRGSDPDAALYYLARMLEAGEDPVFVARRMVVFASEDIGNADPRAIMVATAVADAVKLIGMPEARINLAHGVTYLASAPKSNASYVAIIKAIEDVHKYGALPVPLHIRNAPTQLMKELGYSKGYEYAHDQADAIPTHSHLPDKLVGTEYYSPKHYGYEKRIAEWLDISREKRSVLKGAHQIPNNSTQNHKISHDQEHAEEK